MITKGTLFIIGGAEDKGDDNDLWRWQEKTGSLSTLKF